MKTTAQPNPNPAPQPDGGRIVEGERTVLEGAAEIVSKVLTVVCVIVPVWLAERARR